MQRIGSCSKFIPTKLGGQKSSGLRMVGKLPTLLIENFRMFESARRFRLWEYRVSHNQLLIRSPKNSDFSTNIDLVFWGVEFLKIPSSFNGLSVRKGSKSDDRLNVKEIDSFIFESSGQEFFLEAGGCKILENELDIFEASLEGFAATDENRDIGREIASL